MRDSVRSLPAADRNLLFGVLALQMDLGLADAFQIATASPPAATHF
jgi:hypothetical protein